MSPGYCHLMMHPSRLEELLKLCVDVYSPLWLVCRTFNLCPLHSQQGLFHFIVEDLTLLLQDIHPCVVCVVINECEELYILSSTKWWCIHLSAHIAVKKLQWCGWLATHWLEWSAFLLSCTQASLKSISSDRVQSRPCTSLSRDSWCNPCPERWPNQRYNRMVCSHDCCVMVACSAAKQSR